MARKYYDFRSIRSLTDRQLEQAVTQVAKTANRRLEALEKRGLTQYAYQSVEKVRKGSSKAKRFSTKLTGKSKKEIAKELNALEDFFNRPTSTVTGAKKAHEKAVKRLKEDRIVGVSGVRGLEINETNRESFFNFISSQEYKDMERLVASEDLQEFFIDVQDQISEKALTQLFRDFQNADIGWNEIYSEIERLQDLQFDYEHNKKSMSKEDLKEYEKYFK